MEKTVAPLTPGEHASPTVYTLEREIVKLKADQRELQARFAIMEAFFIKEFPKYFAGEAPLVFAENGSLQGEEILPDIHPVDLRTDKEKASGECYQLSDMVDMGNMGG